MCAPSGDMRTSTIDRNFISSSNVIGLTPAEDSHVHDTAAANRPPITCVRMVLSILSVSAGGRRGSHLPRVEGQDDPGTPRPREGRREPGRGAGLLADEQGSSAARAVQGA